MQTYYSSPADVALASCMSTNWIQAHMPSAPVVGWTNTGISGFHCSAYCRHWPPLASVCIWEDVPFHAQTTVSATKVSLLPILVWNALLS